MDDFTYLKKDFPSAFKKISECEERKLIKIVQNFRFSCLGRLRLWMKKYRKAKSSSLFDFA